jgi:hypothetical protein
MGAILLFSSLAAGCGLHLQTKSVQTNDTYERWDARMETMPFVFHDTDGHIEVFDDHGKRWSGPTYGLDEGGMDHVEVYIGSFGKSYPSLCAAKSPPPPTVSDADANVIAALCDRNRTVVSFTDQVRDRVITAKTGYVPRVRHLLLEGIFESAAQEPQPLHE